VSTNQRVRGRKLQAIRAAHFRAYPLCVRCEAKGQARIATELDHIVALDNGGTDTDDNRQGLCADCHLEKTAEDLGYRHRPRVMIGADGFPIERAGPGAGMKNLAASRKRKPLRANTRTTAK
jgi:5-methylcytosine-specific restriction endonuclease McrA